MNSNVGSEVCVRYVYRTLLQEHISLFMDFHLEYRSFYEIKLSLSISNIQLLCNVVPFLL
jgi:hypothetical protein